MGLFGGPKRLISLMLKFNSSNSVCKSSGVTFVGIPLRTTFRVRSSGSLADTKSILFSKRIFWIMRNCFGLPDFTRIVPSEDALAEVVSRSISAL